MRICHITINNIELERRIFNQIETARISGYKVLVIAPGKPGDRHRERAKGFVLWRIISRFHTGGPLKYIVFNFKLFFYLLFTPIKIIHCHDLWPLPAAALASLLKNSSLIYDAHEYNSGLKIFNNRPIRKQIWMILEWLAIPLVDILVTVSHPLGELYQKRYPQLKKVRIIRNLPKFEIPQVLDNLKIVRKDNEKIILFHGHFKPGRGLENLVISIKRMNDVRLFLVGGGELKSKLQQLVNKLEIRNQVNFIDYINKDYLVSYAAQADIGVVLFEPTSINYSFALPNKLFEYIMAGLPVLASNIQTFEYYIKKYKIGKTVDPAKSELIAEILTQMINDIEQIKTWKNNCLLASKELNWENESKKMAGIYESFE